MIKESRMKNIPVGGLEIYFPRRLQMLEAADSNHRLVHNIQANASDS
jgi:plasmid maintenance system killer protein